jgi:hypothetical protein
MEKKTESQGAADRRQGDRRISADADYRGPERRRVADRRSGSDRRHSPRMTVAD